MMRRRFWRNEDGASAVEFALVLPLLLLVLWGIVDIGRAFYTLNGLSSALREGARTAAVMSSDPTIAANKTIIRTTVKNAFAPLGPPLDTSLVTVSLASRRVTVTANYAFAPLALVGWTFTITRSSTFRWEQSP